MTASYRPNLSCSIGVCANFSGKNASEVVENIIQAGLMPELLGINSLAGYRLHELKIHKAQWDRSWYFRDIEIQWQAMPDLPQESEGKHSPITTKVIRLERGIDDAPDSEWVWVLVDGKLNAQFVKLEYKPLPKEDPDGNVVGHCDFCENQAVGRYNIDPDSKNPEGRKIHFCVDHIHEASIADTEAKAPQIA